MQNGWIGVDLDGTLATYQTGDGIKSIGLPVPMMVERVKDWIAEGKAVKIVTARVAPLYLYSSPLEGERLQQYNDAWDQREMIQHWCIKHIGVRLEVTAVKDYAMICLYDDRCVQVQKNTGRLIGAE